MTRAETGFYPHEQQEFDADLEKPYEALDSEDCAWLIEEGEIFLPELYLGYFAPALAEHASELVASPRYDDDDLIERLVRIIKKAQTVNGDQIGEGLRAAIRKAGWRTDYHESPEPADAPYPAGHAFARALLYVLEREGDSEQNVALLSSSEPSEQLAVVELSRAVLDAGWTFSNPDATKLWTADAILVRLEFDHSQRRRARRVRGQGCTRRDSGRRDSPLWRPDVPCTQSQRKATTPPLTRSAFQRRERVSRGGE